MTDKPDAKPKEYFDVKIDMMIPTTITYKILAEDAEQALEIANKTPPSPRHMTPVNISRGKKTKARVYMYGTSTIKHTKNY